MRKIAQTERRYCAIFLVKSTTNESEGHVMRLLRKTKKLKIVKMDWEKNEDENYEERIAHPLYEVGYLSAIKDIFETALKQRQIETQNEKGFLDDEKRNILSFIGRRGSGKTTSMGEFCKILASLHVDEVKNWWIDKALETEEEKIKLREINFKFYVLPPIDASLLGEKEDFFELILVNIYKEFERDICIKCGETQQIEQRREIAGNLQNILDGYFSTQGKNENNENERNLAAIMNFMAGGRDVQKLIEKLIDLLFKLRESHYDCEYIVIAIDDLDLNIGHGYEMLEQLQKFFSYYKIIILLTLDYNQMQLVCKEHFYKALKCVSDRGDYENHINNLTNDYLKKVFHYSQRIYMPDVKRLSKRVEIVLEKDEKETITVKNFLMRKIAEIMLIYYDGCGLKRHFCEPDTVRELVTYNDFLETLTQIDYEKLVPVEKFPKEDPNDNTKISNVKINNEKILRAYDQNHERFNEDIRVRLAENTLTYQQKEAFEKLIERDIQRRAMYFIGMEKSEHAITIGDINQDGYSYGDLLEKIYKWGRSYFEDKPFISCVLASMTSEMVREYLNYRYNKESAHYRNRLVQFLGQSFGNSWCGEAFPKIDEDGFGIIGYNREAQVNLLDVRISFGTLKNTLHVNEFEGTNKTSEWKTKIKNWLQEEQILETLQVLDLLCVRRTGEEFKGLDFRFSCEKIDEHGAAKLDDNKNAPKANEKKKADKELKISGIINGENKSWITLDIMAFVPKSLNYEREKERFHGNVTVELTKVLSEYLELGETGKKKLEKILGELIRENSEFGKYMGEDFIYETAFPFYNLDLSYNIWKRVRRKYVGQYIESKDIFKYIVLIYKEVEKCLEEEGEFYSGEKDKKEEYKNYYLQIFKNCPYIKMVEKIANDERENIEIISQRLAEALKNMILGSKLAESSGPEAEKI